MSATPCDRCGQVVPRLILTPACRLLCPACHAIEVSTPAPLPDPKRRGRPDPCNPFLPPGFEVKS